MVYWFIAGKDSENREKNQIFLSFSEVHPIFKAASPK
jgi:hypothetical protein